MTRDTKPNFNSSKFEQCITDIMNLSGCTQIYGKLDFESGSTLTICDNIGAGKVLTSNASGVATWQPSVGGGDFSGVTSVANGLSISGGDVVLGGLIDRNTNIELPIAGTGTTFSLSIGNSTGESEIYIENGDNGYVQLNDGDVAVLINSSAVTIQSSICGAVYAGDYEANFVNRSLVTKQYVDTGVPSGTTNVINFNSHTGDTSIHYVQSAITINENQVTNLINDLGNLNDGVTGNTAAIALKANQADFVSHSGDTSIHYVQSAITITENQVTNLIDDLAGKTSTGTTEILRSDLNSHTGDTSIHYVQSAITINENQVTNLPTDLEYIQDQIDNLSALQSTNTIFVFENTPSDIGGYETLSLFAHNYSATTESVALIAGSGETLIDSYITPSTGLAITGISSGIWIQHFHAYTSSITGGRMTYMRFKYYKRDTGGTETLLWTSTDILIDSTTIKEFQNTEALPTFTGFTTTDRLVTKVYGLVTGLDVTLSWVYGISETSAFIDLPIISESAPLWSNVTAKPSWLDYDSINDFQTGHTHSYTNLTDKPDLSVYVPYVGATTNVNLGTNNLTTTGTINSTYINIPATNSNFIGLSAGSGATNAVCSNFFGQFAGCGATGANNSNFLGRNAGRDATGADNSNFFGQSAGCNAIGADFSNFIGVNSGLNASGVTRSNFIGQGAGYGGCNSCYSNFIGSYAGNWACDACHSNFIGQNSGCYTFACNSNFIGRNAGKGADLAHHSNFFGNYAGCVATNATDSNFIGRNAGQGATNANNSNFFGQNSGSGATGGYNSNFIGQFAGCGATGGYNSNFIGQNAGNNATFAGNSNFIGQNAGNNATDAISSNFIGNSAGFCATGASNSNFIGGYAGNNAINAFNSNFIGNTAGMIAINAQYSNLIGYYAGFCATNASDSNFLGRNAGFCATDASNSNFIGCNAGCVATGAYNSNFIGESAGHSATGAFCSNFIGKGSGSGATFAYSSNFFSAFAGKGATNASDANFLGYEAGCGATGGYNSNFIGFRVGKGATGADNSNFLGNYTGFGALNAYNSNFLGTNTGCGAINANNSNFIGLNAGCGATGANNSNFFGNSAGKGASSASNSNFIGLNAGLSATNANNSNFLGLSAGQGATGADNSNFLGRYAGRDATGAENSNFLGYNAGFTATGASYSTFIGYQAGNWFSGNNVGNNNIIIGTNITLPNAATNSINIGGVLFGTGTYDITTGNPSISGQTNGKIGIGMIPITDTLEVSGNIRIFNGFIKRSTTSSITASTTQTQGQQQLISDINEISIVATTNDVVTLPSAVAGLEILIINNGANTLQIYPATGDDLGAGVNSSTTLIAGDVVTFVTYDNTNWITKS